MWPRSCVFGRRCHEPQRSRDTKILIDKILVDKIEDRRPVEFSVDPEDRNRQDLLPRCDEYVDHDYVHDEERVVRERLLPLRFEDPDFDYFDSETRTPTSTTMTALFKND